MHYFIDGYNLLFRLSLHEKKNFSLQSAREYLIKMLNEKISRLSWNVSLIFDAAFQVEEHTRGHFEALEIHFTSFGQSADEYIIETIRHCKNPHREIVVTSDKKLSMVVRGLSAKTESCEEFIHRMLRNYENKISVKRIKKDKIHPQAVQKGSITTPEQQLLDHYESIFRTAFEQSQQESQKKTQEQPKKIKCKKKIAEDMKKTTVNEMERWLQIFENRLET